MFKAAQARMLTNNAKQGGTLHKGQIIDAIRKAANSGEESLTIKESVSKIVATELSSAHDFKIESTKDATIISW